MDALRAEAAEEGAAVGLHLEARGASVAWSRHASFEPKTAAAEAIEDAIQAPGPAQRRR